MFFPSYIASKLQPLNVFFVDELNKKIEHSVASLVKAGTAAIPPEDIPSLTLDALQTIEVTCVTEGFRDTGCLPLDTSAVQATVGDASSKKRSIKIHDPETIEKAAADYENGMTLREVSLKYDIPKTTLQRHITGKYRGYTTSFGRPTVCPVSTE